MKTKIVALLSDFGGKDAYVGVMKAVILGVDASISIVDLTHEIPPHDPLSAAYVLYSAWEYFPQGSSFCAVVDPGVGSERKSLLARIQDRYLIGPDNGLISLLLRMYTGAEVFSLNVEAIAGRFSGSSTGSRTFHGRDLFAPAAALCARGESEWIRGRPIEAQVIPQVFPTRDAGNRRLRGCILHIDRFGNCICSLHAQDLDKLRTTTGTVTIHGTSFELDTVSTTYSDVPVGDALCLIGSSGFLEVAVREGSAAKTFDISPGQEILAII